MKNLKMTMMLLMIIIMVLKVNGQTESRFYTIKGYDEMSDRNYFYANDAIIFVNKENTKGFGVKPFISREAKIVGLIVKMVNIGNCNEKDEIIILFENGERLIKESWNDYNCKGNAYFTLTEQEINLLRNHPIKKIRMTNGRSYDTFTGDVPQEDKLYFIKILEDIDNKRFVEK